MRSGAAVTARPGPTAIGARVGVLPRGPSVTGSGGANDTDAARRLSTIRSARRSAMVGMVPTGTHRALISGPPLRDLRGVSALLLREKRADDQRVRLAIGTCQDDPLEAAGRVLDPEGVDLRGRQDATRQAGATVGRLFGLEVGRFEGRPRPGERLRLGLGLALHEDAPVAVGRVDVGWDRSAVVEVAKTLSQ